VCPRIRDRSRLPAHRPKFRPVAARPLWPRRWSDTAERLRVRPVSSKVRSTASEWTTRRSSVPWRAANLCACSSARTPEESQNVVYVRSAITARTSGPNAEAKSGGSLIGVGAVDLPGQGDDRYRCRVSSARWIVHDGFAPPSVTPRVPEGLPTKPSASPSSAAGVDNRDSHCIPVRRGWAHRRAQQALMWYLKSSAWWSRGRPARAMGPRRIPLPVTERGGECESHH
jgi:hypothetical protein